MGTRGKWSLPVQELSTSDHPMVGTAALFTELLKLPLWRQCRAGGPIQLDPFRGRLWVTPTPLPNLAHPGPWSVSLALPWCSQAFLRTRNML